MLSGAGCHTVGEGAGGGDAAVVALSRCMLFCTVAAPSAKKGKHLLLLIAHSKASFVSQCDCGFDLVSEQEGDRVIVGLILSASKKGIV